MFSLLVRRLIATLPLLLVVTLLVFLMLRLGAEDPAAALAGESASAEQVEQLRGSLGLQRPLPVQYVVWLAHVVTGDLGQSHPDKTAVTALIAQRLGPTFGLAALSIVIAVAVGVPLGMVAAWRPGGGLDRALAGLSTLGLSVPVFVLAYALIWAVALELGWLPAQGYQPLAAGARAWLAHLALPALTLSVMHAALLARATRAALLDALAANHVRTARANGLGELRVLLRHALAHAAVPLARSAAAGMALLIGGLLVIESVYAIPGLGQLTVEAVRARDFATIQGLVLFFAVVCVLTRLASELALLFFDPRTRA